MLKKILLAAVKIGTIAGLVFGFVVALELIRAGVAAAWGSGMVAGIAEAARDPARAFGGAAIAAGLAMAGSTVAGTAVGLAAAGATDPTGLAAMIFGSRIAPNTVLFLAGAVAIFHGKTVARGLSLALLEWLTKVPLLAIAALLTPWAMGLPGLDRAAGALSLDLAGAADDAGFSIDFLKNLAVTNLGGGGTLAAGIAGLVLVALLLDHVFSFAKFDRGRDEHKNLAEKWETLRAEPIAAVRGIPAGLWLRGKNFWLHLRGGDVPAMLSNPLVAFVAGFGITAVTFSMSISMAFLLPFYLAGAVGPAMAIPFILGANVSTFGDTLFLAMASGEPGAVRAVLAVVLAVGITAALILPVSRIFAAAANAVADAALRRGWLLGLLILAAFLGPGAAMFF